MIENDLHPTMTGTILKTRITTVLAISIKVVITVLAISIHD